MKNLNWWFAKYFQTAKFSGSGISMQRNFHVENYPSVKPPAEEFLHTVRSSSK